MSLLGFLKSLATSADPCTTRDVEIRGTKLRLKRCENYPRPGYDTSKVSYLLFGDGADPEAMKSEGTMHLVKRDRDRVVAVDSVFVDDKLQKKGVGTFLYEEAVRDSCRLGYALQSDYYRSEFSEAFWQKQARKGRASCVAGRGEVFRTPLEEAQHFALDPVQFESMAAQLPKPQGGEYDKHWTCRHYRIENPCETPSLAGLKTRRKRLK